MVGLSQNGHDLSLHKFPTAVAESAVKPLEVQRAEVVTILHEEATLSQVTSTNCTHMQGKWMKWVDNIKKTILLCNLWLNL